MRFTIRDVLWLTVAVALAVGWWIDRANLVQVARDARHQANETEIERAKWEQMTQRGAVAHNQTLRVIEESGLRIVSHGGKLRLEKGREIREGFNPP
jgi:hypothetical protein